MAKAQTGSPIVRETTGPRRRALPRIPIFLPGYYTEAALIAREARGAGFRGRLLGGDGWNSASLHASDDNTLVGDFFLGGYDPAMSASASQRYFLRAWRQTYGSDPDGLGAIGYDAVRLAVDALRRVGAPTPEPLRDALENFWGVSGAFGELLADGQRNVRSAMAILEVRESGFQYRASLSP